MRLLIDVLLIAIGVGSAATVVGFLAPGFASSERVPAFVAEIPRRLSEEEMIFLFALAVLSFLALAARWALREGQPSRDRRHHAVGP